MKRPDVVFNGFLIATVALLAVFFYVEYRTRNPEWMSFQQKSLALAKERLHKELASEMTPEKKNEIASQIELLEKSPLEVKEIRPFGGKLPPERCLTCHFGIEDLSEAHPNAVFGCVSCHGGNGLDLTVQGAHRHLRGGRNPASLDLASASCGKGTLVVGPCHSQREHHLLNRTENVPRSLMATNAGIIGVLRFQWGLTLDGTSCDFTFKSARLGEPSLQRRFPPNPLQETLTLAGNSWGRVRGVPPGRDYKKVLPDSSSFECEAISGFAVKEVTDGKNHLREIPPEVDVQGTFSLPDSHFRKFCAACHLWTARSGTQFGRLQGCPACHAPYNEDGRYLGGDPTINRNESGHAATHSITNRIPDDRCRACHNRSGRIGLSYHGEMESTQYGTPFVHGGLNDARLPDGRFLWKPVPDVHHEKGMNCIDCHTGQDTMGDGSIHTFMKDQTEIRCEDCHGSHNAAPTATIVHSGDQLLVTLLRSLSFVKLSEGDAILRTSKGRPLPHVKLTEKGYRLTSKVTGKEHPVSIITGKKDGHAIKGHERLECDSCHSAWSPQCYGCHQSLDLGAKGPDHLTGKISSGRWAEGRGFFRYERNIYGVNARGKIGILVPGCQIWNTVVNPKGEIAGGYDSVIMRLPDGNSSIKMAPTHPHTTRKEVPRCVDCHLDSKSLGLGEGLLKLNVEQRRLDVEPLYNSRASGLKIDFPEDAAVDPQGNALQGRYDPLSRGFNREELLKITSIGPCLACHDRYDDPVWRKPGPYGLTPKCRKALERR